MPRTARHVEPEPAPTGEPAEAEADPIPEPDGPAAERTIDVITTTIGTITTTINGGSTVGTVAGPGMTLKVDGHLHHPDDPLPDGEVYEAVAHIPNEPDEPDDDAALR